MNFLFFLSLCIGSAIAYRCGGASGYNTKFRDLGCPAMALFALWHLFGFHWLYFLVFGLMFGALTTYYDTIFGFDCMYAHGAGIGLATLPLLWIGIHWYSILAYTLVLALSMGLISHKTKLNAVVKELGRGELIVALLWLLTI